MSERSYHGATSCSLYVVKHTIVWHEMNKYVNEQINEGMSEGMSEGRKEE